jgi:hypothetical protein
MRRNINARESFSKKALLTGLGANVRIRKATDDGRKSWRKYGRLEDIYPAL